VTGTLQEDQYAFLIIYLSVPLQWKMFQIKRYSSLEVFGFQEKNSTQASYLIYKKNEITILCSVIFFENRAVYEIMWKNNVELDRPQMTIQHGACALHAVYLRLDSHTQNMQYLFDSQCSNGYANAPQRYVIRTLPVLFRLIQAF